MRQILLILFVFAGCLSSLPAVAKPPHPVAVSAGANTMADDIRLDHSTSAAASASSDEEDVTGGSDDDFRSGSDGLAMGIDRDNFAAGDAETDGPDASGALSRDGGFNLTPAR